MRLLSRPAKFLLLGCMGRSNETMSDGNLTKSDLRLVGAEVDLDSKEESAAVAELLRAGFLLPAGLDVKIANFLGVSRAERERRQDLDRNRKQRQRDGGVAGHADVTPEVRDAERDIQRDAERDIQRDMSSDGQWSLAESAQDASDHSRDNSVTIPPDALPAEIRDKKEEKRGTEERESTSRPAAPVREDIEQLCLHMADSVVRRGAKRPTITAGWRTEARLMLDQDQRPLEEAIAVIDWSEADPFWSGNVLSIPTLRKQYDRLNLKRGRKNGSATKASADLSKFDEYTTAHAVKGQ